MRRRRLRPRVLVVEHDPELQRSLRDALAGRYDVWCAGDAIAAVREARRCEPDVVLVAFTVPAGRAPALVARLRACPEVGHVPAVVVGDWLEGWSWHDLLAIDAAFVPKPVDRHGLLVEIEHALAA